MAANYFLAEGGDGFATFAEGVDRVGGASDFDALLDYLEARSPVSPPPMGRIDLVQEKKQQIFVPTAAAA